MRYYLPAFILFATGLFSACHERVSEPSGPMVEEYTYGLNSVVLLTKDTLQVVLSDYFKEDATVDSIHFPRGLDSDWQPGENELRLFGKMEAWIDAMEVYINGQMLVVPVKRPAMEKVRMTLASYQEHDSIDMVGDLNSWTAGVHRYDADGYLDLELAPGGYAYRLIVDGEEMLDPANASRVPNGFGAFNSFLKVEPSNADLIPHLVVKDAVDDLIHVVTSVDDGKWFALWQNQSIEKVAADNLFAIPEAAKELQRSYVRIWSETPEGLSNEVRIPLEHGKVITSTEQLTRYDNEGNIMYFMMVDRFVNGDTSIDEPAEDERILPRANYFGGDLEGVRQKLEEGYFDDLGIKHLVDLTDHRESYRSLPRISRATKVVLGLPRLLADRVSKR